VQADPTGVSQIVLNLLINAMESIASGTPQDNRLQVSTFATAERGGVVIEVSGPGNPTGNDVNPFDPFPAAVATVRDPQRGLGLAVIHDLARGLRGDVRVTNTPTGRQFVAEFLLATD
jgi:C4-dicarboxylate-specific signal transduction histidine kinase